MKSKKDHPAMKPEPVAVIGGGPVGLICALYLARVRRLPVLLIEQQPALGGLYASVETAWGPVDQGVHILQESGDAVLDQLLFSVLPPEEWHVLEAERKDIAGNIFGGRLDAGSLYPDLRQLPAQDFRECLAGIFTALSLSRPGTADAGNLRNYFEKRFGAIATGTVFEAIAQKLWRRPLEQLDPVAVKLVHLARVVAYDEALSASLKKSPVLDEIFGFPDQMKAPAAVFAGRGRALYPRRFGLKHVVSGLVQELEREGVRLLTSADIESVRLDGSRIVSLACKDRASGETRSEKISSVVWTSPLPALTKLLKLAPPPLPDAFIPHRVVHLFLNQPPLTRELYWLWSYDSDDCLVRVSSPHAYCSDAASGGVFPVCVELHLQDAAMPDAAVAALAEEQLRARSLIGAGTRVVGSAVLATGRAFFVPSVANCEAMKAQRQLLEDSRPENLVVVSQDLSAGIFYMPEILRAAISKFQSL
jgi:protoporphyrinogen oxidase